MAQNKINEKLKARTRLVELYTNALKENKIPWHQEWANKEKPFNPVSKTIYHGINNLILNYIAIDKVYTDPRWCTLKQANDNHWCINKGAKSVPIEYWMPFDKETRQYITWPEYNKRCMAQEDVSNITLYCKTSYVFNAVDVIGIPEYTQEFSNKFIYSSPFIQNVIKQLGVGYVEQGDQAYYSPTTDTVVIPENHLFSSNYAYYATQLHELSHSTGHKTRLNRTFGENFGDKEYAKEELRAEIAASFLAQELNVVCEDEYLNNHKAYIQSFLEILENEPEELFRAIKDADKIHDYILDKGEWELIQERIQSTSLYETVLDQLKENREYAKSMYRLPEKLTELMNDGIISEDVYETCMDNQDTVFNGLTEQITSYLGENTCVEKFKDVNYPVIVAMIYDRTDLYLDAIVSTLEIDSPMVQHDEIEI